MRKYLTLGLASLMLLVNSCSKPSNNNKSHTITPKIEEQSFIQVLLFAAVVITMQVIHGQYQKTTYPNGTVKEECDGIFGTCAMNLRSNGIILSSSSDYDTDHEITNTFLGKTHDGKCVLGIQKDGINNDYFNQFFYSDNINISRPFLLDDPNVINTLGLPVGTSIEIVGDYNVYGVDENGDGTNDGNVKYIVIHE